MKSHLWIEECEKCGEVIIADNLHSDEDFSWAIGIWKEDATLTRWRVGTHVQSTVRIR